MPEINGHPIPIGQVQTWGKPPNTHIITATIVEQPKDTPHGTYFHWTCQECEWDGGIVGYSEDIVGPNNGFRIPDLIWADETICEHINWVALKNA